MEGPGFDCRQIQEVQISKTPRPTIGTTQTPVQLTPGFSPTSTSAVE